LKVPSDTSSGKRSLENKPIVVKLRIHADTEDLDVKWAREALSLSEKDPSIMRVFEYGEGEGVVGCDFRDGEPLSNLEEIKRWYRPIFRVVTEWLRGKSIEQFRRLRNGGSKTDLLIVGHTGNIPLDFLKEVVRLELELLVVADH
jgi:hypothetical protein